MHVCVCVLVLSVYSMANQTRKVQEMKEKEGENKCAGCAETEIKNKKMVRWVRIQLCSAGLGNTRSEKRRKEKR